MHLLVYCLLRDSVYFTSLIKLISQSITEIDMGAKMECKWIWLFLIDSIINISSS